MITVYVGDVTEYLGQQAGLADSSALLITESNFENLTPGTYYTSLGDVGNIINFSCVLRQADKIIYAPPEQWSDQRNNFSQMKAWTEDYLRCLHGDKQIQGFDFPAAQDQETMLSLVSPRQVKDNQLWVSGCSITYGTGVQDNQRYGQLLADALDMPVTFLAYPGSSITWQADQILRSDIRAGDIVVWGLTAQERFPYFKNNKITHVTSLTYKVDTAMKHKVDIAFLDSQQLMYQAVVEIHQVINFCHKIGAKLILAQLLGTGLELYLKDHANYQMLYGHFGRNHGEIFMDVGTDNDHPGPLTHQWYCDKILEKYNQVYRDQV